MEQPTDAGVPAIVLLSGGLDSATVLAIARRDGYKPVTVAFDYGQRHCCELERSRLVSAKLGAVAHHQIRLDPRPFSASALTGGGAVPVDRSVAEMESGLAPTYVPARNTVFLSIALAMAEETGIRDLFIGVNHIDYSGYPDCRPAFIEAFERVANLGTSAATGGQPFRIHAPLIRLSKAEIIRLGVSLGVDYGLTVSCYQADEAGRACGRCDACRLRRAGFSEAGVPDPTVYY